MVCLRSCPGWRCWYGSRQFLARFCLCQVLQVSTAREPLWPPFLSPFLGSRLGNHCGRAAAGFSLVLSLVHGVGTTLARCPLSFPSARLGNHCDRAAAARVVGSLAVETSPRLGDHCGCGDVVGLTHITAAQTAWLLGNRCGRTAADKVLHGQGTTLAAFPQPSP